MLHCQRGADRTGLAATVVRLLFTDDSVGKARRQLLPRYGHFRVGRTAVIDQFFDYYEAWLAFLAIVVWHLYQNIVNPDVYPMNWTWLTGKIPGWQMHHEHPREYERLREEALARAVDVASPASPAADPGDRSPGVTPPDAPSARGPE